MISGFLSYMSQACGVHNADSGSEVFDKSALMFNLDDILLKQHTKRRHITNKIIYLLTDQNYSQLKIILLSINNTVHATMSD